MTLVELSFIAIAFIGILFRGPGWNWTYPWIDGVWFDDLLDWVHFE